MSLLRWRSGKSKRTGSGQEPETDAERVDAAASGSERSAASTAIANVDTLVQQRRFAQALALVVQALADAPDNAELLFAKGSALLAWGRSREALAVLKQAQGLGLRSPALWLNLGWASLNGGAIHEAEASMREAVAIDPVSWRAHVGLATVLNTLGKTEEAVKSFERTLELNSNDIDSILSIGACRIAQGAAAAAEKHFRAGIALQPDHSQAWNSLGVALEHQERHAEARVAFERAVAIESSSTVSTASFVNLALNLQADGHSEQALQLLERNLDHRGTADAQGTYAQMLRTAGRLPDGWTHFEFRWLKEPLLSDRPRIAQPIWNGQDLRGKTILLRAEQGMGDTIQFIRYARHVKSLGATVFVAVQNAVRPLIRTLPSIDRVLAPGDSLPPVDYYVHLLSLPRIFGSTVDSIPQDVPYLQADSATAQRWERRLSGGDGLKVGLTWAGRIEHVKDRERSMSLGMFAPWAGVKGVRFFSLQKGPLANEAQAPPAGLVIDDLSNELNDFADTAAAISQLDLVISVDTSVAHLAGALGKPVWLMLPSPAEWRWMEQRKDSPWYPTMRLFRQHRRGDWGGLVLEIRDALSAHAKRGRNLTSRIISSVSSPASKAAPPPIATLPVARLPKAMPGHRPGFSAVAETRYGIVQYLPDEPIVGDSIGWYGEYLEEQLDVVRRMLVAGATVVEVDAGAGLHSLALAAAVGPSGHLLLYEQRARLQQMLRFNLSANRFDNATVMRGSLGSASAPPDVETVDDLYLERLDWLKINNGETAPTVLHGATDTLWRLRPVLLIAANDDPALMDVAAIAKDAGYRGWRMETRMFNPANFNRRDEDIFGDRTALALLAIPEEFEGDTAFEGCIELA